MIPPRIKNAILHENYDIEIEYQNGEKKIYNFKKMLSYSCYNKLKEISFFLRGKSVGTTIEWPDGVDIDPNELYLHSAKQ